jgi:hypothetical protein
MQEYGLGQATFLRLHGTRTVYIAGGATEDDSVLPWGL